MIALSQSRDGDVTAVTDESVGNVEAAEVPVSVLVVATADGDGEEVEPLSDAQPATPNNPTSQQSHHPALVCAP